MSSIFKNKIPIILSISLLIVIFILTNKPMFGMSEGVWKMLGLVIPMILLWCFEVIPLGITALLPIVYAPLVGLEKLTAVTASFSHPIIFLFLGGFIIGAAIENTGLHKRIAMLILCTVGNNPRKQLLAFMGVSALISMWISNTSTVIMLLPVALAVIGSLKHKNPDSFAKPVLIGIAYAASIGGTATLIGTPPNLLLKGFLEKQAIESSISFLHWMIFATPLATALLFMAYFVLLKQFKVTNNKNLNVNFDFKRELALLGKITKAEKIVLTIFLLTAFCWIFRIQINTAFNIMLTDEIISVIALLTLFIFPIDFTKKEFAVTLKDLNKLPWDILLLFGGGLALADLFVKTGLATWFAQSLSEFKDIPTFSMIAYISTMLVFLTELTSNTAITATFLPLFGSFALEYGIHIYNIAIPLALSASLAFMLPVATPPNAIVFASGHVKITDLLKAGFYLNIISIICVTIYSYFMIPVVFSATW